MNVEPTIEQGLEHHRAGRLREAEAIYRQILSRDPRRADVLHLMGALAFQVGRVDVAVDLIGRAIAIDPLQSQFYHDLAQIFTATGKLGDAVAVLHRARAALPRNPLIANSLGVSLHLAGRFEEAAEAYRKALAIDPEFADASYNAGISLRALGKLDEAIDAFRRAITLRPVHPQANSNLGMSLLEAGMVDEAIAACRIAVAQSPAMAEAHNNLGNALRAKGCLDEAVACYEQAATIQPGMAEAHNNLGTALIELGRFPDSIPLYRRAIALQPDWPFPHYNLGLALLATEQFAEGYVEHEWRLHVPEMSGMVGKFAEPIWDGGDPHGRTILIHAEQGFGDAIQHCRFIPAVVARGGRVFFQCHAELVSFLQTLAGPELVIARGEALPKFDLHCPLMSLPRRLGTSVETIPVNIPYLHAHPARVAGWRARLSTAELKIGLAWSARPKPNPTRSMPAEFLSPFVKVEGVRFVSLQKSAAARHPDDLPLDDWTNELHDFADTAALIQNLDLVITIDSVAAHIAGALGKPVWTLLPHAADWRWMVGRSNSPWYPTMRIFRQPRPGDWPAVIADVVAAIASLKISRNDPAQHPADA